MSDPSPSDDLDAILARRDLRTSRRRWRFVAFLAIAILVIGLGWQAGAAFNRPERQPHLARVIVSGTIVSDRARLEALAALADDDNVEAVLIAVDSGGGATAGGEELYTAIRTIADEKPVAAVIGQSGASAAYMAAIAADHVVSRRVSLVGSIGVYFTHFDASALLETVGVNLDRVTTGPLKAQPDIDEPMPPAVRRSLQTLVDDTYDWFVDIVAERRGLDRNAVLELADGRIMTGRMGLDAGLLDALGGEREAVEWLEAERGVASDLPVLTRFPPPPDALTQLRRSLGSAVAEALGLDASALAPLDGLVSVWHLRN